MVRQLLLLALMIAWCFTLTVCSLPKDGSGGIEHANLDRPSVIFVHRSVGANLIREGDVRSLFGTAGFEFWDHGYNSYGVINPQGKKVEISFDIPDDNTDPDGYAAIFGQPVHDPPANVLSHLLNHDIIAFKSCYPISDIGSDAQLDTYKRYYLTIRDVIDHYPDKMFVVVTPPPNSPGATSPDRSARGRAFANWLKSSEYLAGHPNVFAFDLFDALADTDNHLRAEYRQPLYPIDFMNLNSVPTSVLNSARTLRSMALRQPLYSIDSHPNSSANQKVGPVFVQEIVRAYQTFRARQDSSETLK